MTRPTRKTNPFISNLPPALTPDELFKAVGAPPPYNPQDRYRSGAERHALIEEVLDHLVVPWGDRCISVDQRIRHILQRTYSVRWEHWEEIRAFFYKVNGAPLQSEWLRGAGTTVLVVGPSGSGKSTLIDGLSTPLTKAITHSATYFKTEQPIQVPLVIVRSSLSKSPKELAKNIVNAIRRATGHHHLGAEGTNRWSVEDHFRYAAEQCLIYNVGLILLDEFQEIARSITEDLWVTVVNMLLMMTEEFGLPMGLICTPKIGRLLDADERLAGRIVFGHTIDVPRIENPNSREWQQLCRIGWSYQWVKNPLEYSKHIGTTLHLYAQGIRRLLIAVLKASQHYAIERNIERVDSQVIEAAFQEKCTMIHSMIDALASGDVDRMDKYEHFYHRAFHADVERLGAIQRAKEASLKSVKHQ